MLAAKMAQMAELFVERHRTPNTKTSHVKTSLTHSLGIGIELSLLMIEGENLG